ncbi:hydantoinase/oxoprolinase N-terminal domain-containing protein [Martelella alba]|uniref:Hydantoinase/oxoprolinase family protein n=1 Tax=Martelella alba TaxID=2590451 RepID=A0ABY2SNB6_9HYPH|nr:hydantoinase/oxoprolinase family protein [Martelella alba]TKI06560.1 hydantoinase/oxoprolinase family protein [Martelella alba]
MTYRIGIDVGGTNTDAVLLDRDKGIVARIKQPTTPEAMEGIGHAIAALLREAAVDKSAVGQAMLGTTHCTNAIVERKGLNSLAHFRLGAPATLAIPPMSDIPADLRALLSARLFTVDGGYEYDGALLASLDERRVRECLKSVRGRVDSISVCGVFAPVSGWQERQVAEWAREELGADMPISLSGDIGSVGLLERENAAILNASLQRVSHGITQGFDQALRRHGIRADIFFGQNDGTLMPLRQARAFPVLTIASGPTNSIRGAAYLADMRDALVVDVGGTTTDIGVLSRGLPRESGHAVEIGGVRTNFRMPDIVSIGLGGGSIVTTDGKGAIQIGPQSVGYQLRQRALVFGGDTLTVTDIAVAKGMMRLGDASRVRHLSAGLVEGAFACYVAMVEEVIGRLKSHDAPMPVVLVGGGAGLLPTRLKGASTVIRPADADVANAVGVAIAQVSGVVDTIVSLDSGDREARLASAAAGARAAAINAGAIPDTVDIIELDTLPLAYMPGNALRIRAKAVGTLKF